MVCEPVRPSPHVRSLVRFGLHYVLIFVGAVIHVFFRCLVRRSVQVADWLCGLLVLGMPLASWSTRVHPLCRVLARASRQPRDPLAAFQACHFASRANGKSDHEAAFAAR